MVNAERGVYQPPAKDPQMYDSIEDEEEEGRSRLPILIVVALLVLAAFAGVVWVAYNQGVARGRADAPRVIAAPQGPVRTAPDEAGGSTPYAGLKVYNQPVPPDEEAETSTLAPAPGSAPSEVAAAPAASPSRAPAPAKPAATATVKPATAKPAAPAASPPQPVHTASAAPAAAAPAAAPLVAGSVLLQVGAYQTEDLAKAGWSSFKAKHAGSLGALAPDIRRFDLGPKGVWYRLRIGPFADKESATATCDKLKAESASCFLAAP